MTAAPGSFTSAAARKCTVLRSGEFELVIDPAFGARINSARLAGREILRTVLDEANPDPLQAASFPLVPFSNRVADGRFQFDGKPHQLRRNWHIEDNAIHGEGWKAAWQEVRSGDTFCEHHLTGSRWWPWPYECRQITEIGPDRLRQTLSLTNLGKSDMPAGLGFHPYFTRSPETRLKFEADRVWPPMGEPDFAGHPISGIFDFSAGKGFAPDLIDHCYEGWKGRVRIEHPDTGLNLQVTASSLARHSVLYVPPGEPFFCFEPVSHLSGALNGLCGPQSGLVRLKPNQSLTFSMQIEFEISR